MIKAIDHIGIMVNDLQKSIEFYTEVLGFSILHKMEVAELSAVFVGKNDTKIELMKYKGKKIPKRSEIDKLKVGGNSIPINDHITFSVDDIKTTTTELKAKGIVFDLEPIQLQGGMKLASFKDPEGVLIELMEHAH